MKPVFTSEEMRKAEKNLFSSGVSSIDLMETAAKQLADEVLKALPAGGTCTFACGTGGNGGDGYAAARMTAEKGARTVIVETGNPKSADAVVNRDKAKDKVFAITGLSSITTLPKPDVWVDCIFGIGLNRAPNEDAKALIDRINADKERGSFVISCDIPSGLNANDGSIPGACVNANLTVTFQELKRGHLMGRGGDVCGKIAVKDIGIPKDLYPVGYMRLVQAEDVRLSLPKRNPSAHKNDFGHLLLIAGSRGMAGAAAMAANAALRSGVGLLTVACPNSIVDIIQTLAPSAMCVGLKEKDGAIADEARTELEEAMRGKTAVAIGPGLSRRAGVEIVETILKSRLKSVFDADALNIISEHDELKRLFNENHAITPHPGEANRLLGGETGDQAECAKRLSELGCKVLLKGATSVISGKALTASESGCVGMAKGGSGDVLTGMVGALLAQGMDTETALWSASELHGRAGEAAQKKFGQISMLPTDIISCLGDAFNDVLRG